MIRHVWPPSCSVFEGWGVGLQRFLERAVAQVCREAGGRVGLDRFIRDLDLGAFNPLGGRRIEVIVDGLSLWHGAQLAVDTTVVSPLHGDDGTQPPRAVWHCRQLAGRREPQTPNLQVMEGGPDWWSWRPKWEVVGPRKQRISSMPWRRLGHKNPQILQDSVRTAFVRRWSAIVVLGWSDGQELGQEATSLLRMRW